MSDSPANVWTFLIAVVTLVGVVATPIVNWFFTQRQTRAVSANLAVGEKKINEVHDLVNGQRQELERLVAQLRTANGLLVGRIRELEAKPDAPV